MKDQFIIESIQRPYLFWAKQDEHRNKLDIEMYEKLWKDKARITDKGLRDKLVAGLEMLYAERKEIAVRKAHFGAQAGKILLGWGGERAAGPEECSGSADNKPSDI